MIELITIWIILMVLVAIYGMCTDYETVTSYQFVLMIGGTLGIGTLGLLSYI